MRISMFRRQCTKLGIWDSWHSAHALGSRLSALGSRLSALGSRLSALGSRLSALASRLLALASRLLLLDSRLLLLSWFANQFATWFIRWIAHWLLKSNQMIHPSLISKNKAQTCKCICITCWNNFTNSTKNFERAGIAFNLFLFIASNDAQ
jgi:hypothetical protein